MRDALSPRHFECRVSAAVRKTGIDASVDILRITGQVSVVPDYGRDTGVLHYKEKDFDLALPHELSVAARSRAVCCA